LQPTSAFFRRFYFEGGNPAYDSFTRTLGALHFLFGLSLVFRDRIGELESLPAFLALKFVSGHALLYLMKNAEGMPLKMI